MSLFKLVLRDEETAGGVLGYKQIEVLAIVPFALYNAVSDSSSKSGVRKSWASHGFRNEYVCRTEVGLVTISDLDLWNDIDAGDYVEEGATKEAISHADKLAEEMYGLPCKPKKRTTKKR
jgi:hypothetical protein